MAKQGKHKKYKTFAAHLATIEELSGAGRAASHEKWSGYATALGAVESIAAEGKTSKKVKKRKRQTIKALYKLAKHAGGRKAVLPPKASKRKVAQSDEKAAVLSPDPRDSEKQTSHERSGLEGLTPAAASALNVIPISTAMNEPNISAIANTDAQAGIRAPNAFDAPLAGQADDLKMISGIGPKLEMVLYSLGIYHFDQIAAWSPDDVEWVDDFLRFKGRINRENWIAQADALARGGREEYVRVFGKEPR